jgi:hypothetical protein
MIFAFPAVFVKRFGIKALFACGNSTPVTLEISAFGIAFP